MNNNITTFDFIAWNRHVLIAPESQNILIDTGSPRSFHRDSIIKIGGRVFNVSKNIMGIDSEYLSKQLDYDVSGLIGMDIINEFSVWFNSPRFGNSIGFFDKSDYNGNILTYPNLLGCPCIELFVNHKRGLFLFDSGAPISYVSSKLLSTEKECGRTTDFSPLLRSEKFEVSLYYLETDFSTGNDWRGGFNAMYAKMPKQLEMILSSFGIDGIIGFDLINNNRLIVTNNSIAFPPQGL